MRGPPTLSPADRRRAHDEDRAAHRARERRDGSQADQADQVESRRGRKELSRRPTAPSPSRTSGGPAGRPGRWSWPSRAVAMLAAAVIGRGHRSQQQGRRGRATGVDRDEHQRRGNSASTSDRRRPSAHPVGRRPARRLLAAAAREVDAQLQHAAEPDQRRGIPADHDRRSTSRPSTPSEPSTATAASRRSRSGSLPDLRWTKVHRRAERPGVTQYGAEHPRGRHAARWCPTIRCRSSAPTAPSSMDVQRAHWRACATAREAAAQFEHDVADLPEALAAAIATDRRWPRPTPTPPPRSPSGWQRSSTWRQLPGATAAAATALTQLPTRSRGTPCPSPDTGQRLGRRRRRDPLPATYTPATKWVVELNAC